MTARVAVMLRGSLHVGARVCESGGKSWYFSLQLLDEGDLI
jgi:hypothetical protein